MSDSANFGDAGSIKGHYANYFEVGFNAFELVVDFGQSYQERGKPVLHTRIVTTPAYAWALLCTLRDALERWEQRFGPLPKPEEPGHGQ